MTRANTTATVRTAILLALLPRSLDIFCLYMLFQNDYFMPYRFFKALGFAILIWIVGFVWGSIVFMTPALKNVAGIPYISSNPAISLYRPSNTDRQGSMPLRARSRCPTVRPLREE